MVEFSYGGLQGRSAGIIKPKAERLSPHQEGASEEEDSSSQSSADSIEGRRALVPLGSSALDGTSSSKDEVENSCVDETGDDDNEQNFTNDPPILPQPSILHQIPSIKNATDFVGAQTKLEIKAKRVLSSNTLAALNADAGRNADSPKRMRTSPEMRVNSINDLPELSLGLSAMDAICPLPGRYSPRDSPVFSSDDDEELDKALSDELRRSLKSGGDNLPVPLLTPPQSPLTLPGESSGLVEWPSNLVVDSAMMTAATITRPLSPSSLQKLEEEEEIRLNIVYSRPEPSALTPLLRSIYVGD